jgi:phage shock protein A
MLLVVVLGIGAAVAAIVYLALRARRPSGPEADIRCTIQALEQQQAEAAQAVHRVVTAWKDLRARVQAYQEEAERWGEQARELLAEGNESGARDRLERQVRAEHAAEALRADLQALEEARARADQFYSILKQQHEAVRMRYTALSARQAAAKTQTGLSDFSAAERRAAEAYNQLQEDLADAEARAAAAAEVSAVGSIYSNPGEIDRRLGQLRQ